MALHCTWTNGPSLRPLAWCSARASRFFPVPVSPCSRTGGQRRARRVASSNWRARALRAANAWLVPSNWSSGSTDRSPLMPLLITNAPGRPLAGWLPLVPSRRPPPRSPACRPLVTDRRRSRVSGSRRSPTPPTTEVAAVERAPRRRSSTSAGSELDITPSALRDSKRLPRSGRRPRCRPARTSCRRANCTSSMRRFRSSNRPRGHAVCAMTDARLPRGCSWTA
jgi:hypothetical protein